MIGVEYLSAFRFAKVGKLLESGLKRHILPRMRAMISNVL